MRQGSTPNRPNVPRAKSSLSTRIVAVLLFGLLIGCIMLISGGVPLRAASDPVIVAAGDIACDPTSSAFKGGNGTATACHMKATADLIAGINPDLVLPLGDEQYEQGTLSQFNNSYALSWGAFNGISAPVPGNHEYQTSGASGYFKYFGSIAGDPTKGYYSFNLGAWHLIALNANCSDVGGCGSGSPQEVWLHNDLAAHPGVCTLAYWHQPRFSSSNAGNTGAVKVFWQDLYNAHADLVLNAHGHVYERFALQSPSQMADSNGLREIVAGTGGKSHGSFTSIQPNSQVRNNTTYGVLKVTLHSTGYDWQFVPESGGTFTDSGTQACHSASGSSPTPTPTSTGGGGGTNLLANPGFELDANGDGLPDNWTKWTNFTRSSAVVHGGSYAGQFQATDNSSKTVKQRVTGLSAGTTYGFSGWVNIPATSDSFSFRLRVTWLNSSNSTISSSTIKTYTAATGGWTQATASLIAPSGTTGADVKMIVASLNATIYVDDFSFGP